MTESSKKRRVRNSYSRQIVGFSISPEMAREVKTHAAQRGILLRTLFEEMWQIYKKQSSDAKT
jgi:hypothetical protein